MKNKYTKETLEPLVKQFTTLSELARSLGLNGEGGSASHLSKVIKKFNIDTSHWLGSGWNKGRTFERVPIEDYLSNKRPIKSNELKNKLFNLNLFEQKCYKCLAAKWFDLPIPLELHHIDHNHNNNSLDNLTILCPNCHSYVHKSLPKIKPIKTKTKVNGKQFAKTDKRTINRPPLDVLLLEVEQMGYSATGRKYGVSDNSIRKWIKCYQKYGK